MKLLTNQQIIHILEREIEYKHSRSGGHGGQNVNKRETKAEGYFDILHSKALDEEMKSRLSEKYHNHISKKGVLRITCHEQRNYHQNLLLLKKQFRLLLGLIGRKDVFKMLHHHTKKGHRHS